jgi:hypothetical protein
VIQSASRTLGCRPLEASRGRQYGRRSCLDAIARLPPVQRFAVLPLSVEAVAQTLGPMLVGEAGGSAVGDVPAVCDGLSAEGLVSGRHGGELVTVSLGEVVGHHQQSPLKVHLGAASSVEAVDAAVVLGIAEQRLDGLFAFSIPLVAVL